jgi:hypothetical protein
MSDGTTPAKANGTRPGPIGPERPADSQIDTTGPTRAGMFDRFFDSYFRLRPVNGTFTGDHRFDHLLPDWSPDGLSAARAEMSELRRALAKAGMGVLDRDAVATHDWVAIDGALADAFLEIELAELGSTHFQRGNLSLAIGEGLFGVIALMTRPFAAIEQRSAAAAARLRAFPLFLVGVRRTLEEVTIPDAWRERVLRECEGGRLLLDQIEPWLEAEGAPQSVRSDARVGLAVARESLTWFTAFVKGLRSAADTRYAAGPPLLDLLIRRGHGVDASAESLRWEAHEILEEEYQRLYVALRRAGFQSWQEAEGKIAEERPSSHRLADALASSWEHFRAAVIDHDLVSWPELALRFSPAPPWTREASAYLYYLFYRSPAPLDAETVGQYTIPSPEALNGEWAPPLRRLWNSTAITLNHVLHHGGIGHHLQNWHARRAPSRIGRVAAVDCASRIGMFGGGTMAEGWACYATDLVEETGLLSPLEQLAQQHTRVRHLTRAVVDLELHGCRMTFDDAVRTFVQRTDMSPAAARIEAVKASMFPGTAVMYWLGTREIRRLRAERQRALGPAFSLREFHDELLSFGSIPVALAGRLMMGRREPAHDGERASAVPSGAPADRSPSEG